VITVGDMIEGDLLMDDEGDFYRVDKINHVASLQRLLIVELECLTISEDRLMWSEWSTILSNGEWVWHNRFGSLT